MKELQDLITAYEAVTRSGRSACFATVVNTSGSTYRRPGAHMLIPDDGPAVGTISGGCLENDLVEKAKGVTQSEVPTLVTYDSTSPDDIVLGLGLGCAGVVHVLLERLPRKNGLDPLESLSQCLQHRGGAVASLYMASGDLRGQLGARYVLRADNTTACDLSDTDLIARIHKDCLALLPIGRSSSMSYPMPKGMAQVFIELVRPPLSLIICGAGPDAAPLVRFAKELGWRVTVIDNRTAFLNRDWFSLADQRVFSQPGQVVDQVLLTSDDAVVIMTHNYSHDFQLLKGLLSSPVRYIGLLGPRSKAGNLLQQLCDEGFTPTEEQLARLYNPVGLDIGAETPDEIGLAIVAEIKAVVTGHAGGLLRSRPGPIHNNLPHDARRV
jgi:xanthine dehydrogenase accessory factor